MSIQEIDEKIKKFEDGLRVSFVPADEKEMYKLAIEKLLLRKAAILQNQQTVQSPAMQQATSATYQSDTTTTPDDAKKKSLRQMLVVWKERLLNLLKKALKK